MLQSSQSIIFLLSDTTVHILSVRITLKRVEPLSIFDKDMESFNALSYLSIAGKMDMSIEKHYVNEADWGC